VAGVGFAAGVCMCRSVWCVLCIGFVDVCLFWSLSSVFVLASLVCVCVGLFGVCICMSLWGVYVSVFLVCVFMLVSLVYVCVCMNIHICLYPNRYLYIHKSRCMSARPYESCKNI